MTNVVEGNLFNYQIGQLMAKNQYFQVFRGQGDSRSVLLVVANSGHNAVVDRWAYLLKSAAEQAEKLEEEFIPHRRHENSRLNYHIGFPNLVETFVSPKQNRRIMVLQSAGSDFSQMVPLAKMIRKDNLRVHLRSSVWMMGKSLKILAFLHNHGIEFGGINSGKILFDPDSHFINFFDWSNAKQHSSALSAETCRNEIIQTAQTVLEALGANVATGEYPFAHEVGDAGETYLNHLRLLLTGTFDDANVAHQQFYEMVDKLWEPTFHNFSAFPR